MVSDPSLEHPANSFFFFQAEDGIRDYKVTGVQTCALPITALGEELESGLTVARLEYLVPRPLQGESYRPSNGVFVIDQDDTSHRRGLSRSAALSIPEVILAESGGGVIDLLVRRWRRRLAPHAAKKTLGLGATRFHIRVGSGHKTTVREGARCDSF